MNRSGLRAIPSVDKVLLALGDTGLPHPVVVAVVRRELAAIRAEKSIPDPGGVLARVSAALVPVRSSRIQPLINGTGILAHTNFGRAPLATAAIEAIVKVGGAYNNLEYDLTGGGRGGRAAYLEENLALLCKSQAATVVNNNAAALVLILRHFCEGTRNEVAISRGELVQIGGGFRIPEILESSGARLREVGATNKTSLADYAHAMNRATAMVLKVHRSNFFMGGFVDSPATEEIAALAHKKGIPFVEDLGSGAVIDTAVIAGLEHEPTPAELLRRGVDLVCFSGDKLLGGPQAGVIAGKSKLIGVLKRDPFFRALRCDKLILSALQATVDIYLSGLNSGNVPSKAASVPGQVPGACRTAPAGIPLIEMLRISNDELRERANGILAALGGSPLKATIGAGQAQIGGGALPQSVIPSVTVDLDHDSLSAKALADRLRARVPPVIGFIKGGKLRFDLRTIFAGQDIELVAAIRAVL